MRVDTLVINLTRFGDLLQSKPLLYDLEAAGRKPGLVCLDNFAGALPLLGLEAAWALPGAELLAAADKHWPDALCRLLQWTRRIKAEAGHNCVINLTPTLPGRLAAKLLCPENGRMLGFGMDADGFGVNHGLWSSFLSGSTLHRQNAPFNLADMFRKLGAALCREGTYPKAQTCSPGRFALCPPGPAAEAHAAALLDSYKVEQPHGTALPQFAAAAGNSAVAGFAAFQLGASEARRQWPAASFAALGARLYRERNICPVLLGSPAERPLAEAYAAHAVAPFIDAVGATDILQLAALLRRMRLLITNDTGTMHLAAGLGIPSLAFFTATAQPWDTGPYLPGCCCLEPALPCHPCAYNSPCPHEHICLSRISAQGVGDLALAYLDGKGWEAGCSDTIRREARIWLTDTDAAGLATLRPLSEHGREDRSLWLMQQRCFWSHFLDTADSSENAGSGPRNLGPRTIAQCNIAPPAYAGAADFYACSVALREQVLPVLAQVVRLTALLVEQSGLVGKSAQAGRLFLLNCERVQSLLDACRPLASLAVFWRELCRQYGGRMDALTGHIAALSGQLRDWTVRLESAAAACP